MSYCDRQRGIIIIYSPDPLKMYGLDFTDSYMKLIYHETLILRSQVAKWLTIKLKNETDPGLNSLTSITNPFIYKIGIRIVSNFLGTTKD